MNSDTSSQQTKRRASQLKLNKRDIENINVVIDAMIEAMDSFETDSVPLVNENISKSKRYPFRKCFTPATSWWYGNIH